ncbi:uncharacterized protein LOC131643236 [Vicia villosa]|uniref:uncharacterized protein LOC131643236 n=1 Tax=Vicia villosa TaxID=3911 RepID=UPI00273C0CB2|nr:uncharacterized protein LOC131643236 [Vicia villosa]
MASSASRSKTGSYQSVSNRRWKVCACNMRMVSYRCKNGRNRGRLFWRCPLWQSDETCNLFEWDDEIGSGHDAIEADEEWTNDATKIREMQTFGTLKELYEQEVKKNVEMEMKLGSDGLCGKMKTVCLIVSLIINLYLNAIYKC